MSSHAIDDIRRILETGAASGIDVQRVQILYSKYEQLMDKVLGLEIVAEPNRTKENIVAIVQSVHETARTMNRDYPSHVMWPDEKQRREYHAMALSALEAGDTQRAAASLRLMRLG